MRVKAQTKEVICRSTSPKLKEVLEVELEEFIRNLKVCPEFGTLRYHQGYINALEDVIELVTMK